ncbi:ComEA family DNA-binding protein [uncultured Chloroflexus sp.]|uniref:ComEA family DNA-binding protein n=1 Tax=uncultured Chloroflexus sp. TaxID=214040 RepID=UPI00261713CF|nr:ComEA family DNA-binding protein [uncultured Chloroflexus sp.]
MPSEEQPWYRRPQRIAAVICALLGGCLIAFGPEARLYLWPSVVEQAPVSDPLLVAVLPTPTVKPLVVYVSGAVGAPDVYRLSPEARVVDAIQAAGGLAAQADISHLNLAAPVRDGEHLRVPYVGDVEPVAPVANDSAAVNTAGLINLNRANAAELEELPGVGATLAARIIARRESQGPYQRVEELREVSGIGEKLFAQIAPLVTIDP